MKISASELRAEHIDEVIRFTGRGGILTYSTRFRLNHFITYEDCMELGDIYGETYIVDFDTEIVLEGK